METESVLETDFKVVSNTVVLSLACALESPEEFQKNSPLGSIRSISSLVGLRYTRGTWSFRSYQEIQCAAEVENHCV